MSEDTKRCPYCAEEILAATKRCRHCGEFLEGRTTRPETVTTVSAPSPVVHGNKNRKTKQVVLLLVIAFASVSALIGFRSLKKWSEHQRTQRMDHKFVQFLDGAWKGTMTDANGVSHAVVLRFNSNHNDPESHVGDLNFGENGYQSFMLEMPDKGSPCNRVVQIQSRSWGSDGSRKLIGFDPPFENCFSNGGGMTLYLKETDEHSAELVRSTDMKRIGVVAKE
jgi:hypothetical protein